MRGGVSYVITVKVVQPITGLNQADGFKDKLYVISGSSLNLSQEKIWNYSPSETNQRDLVFSFVGESQGCRIEDGNLVVDQAASQALQSGQNRPLILQFTVKFLLQF